MTSATPTRGDVQRSVRSLTRHPARWVAPILMLLVLCVAYAVYVHKPVAQADQTPAPRAAAKEPADAIAQLTCAVETAQSHVDQSTAQLATLKARAESAGDVNSLQQTASQVRQELEQAANSRQANQELLQRLQTAPTDPAQLVASDARLLASQPAVCRLKEALTAAESKTSQLLLTMLPDHPNVQACRVEEQEIRKQLHSELEVAIRDVQAEQTRLDTQVDTLSKKSADVQEQVQRLVAIHTDYNNQAALARQQTGELKRAQYKLSQAQANQVAPQDPGSFDTVAQPAVMPPANGPGRTLLLAAAIVGGLFVSLGLYTLRGSPVTAALVPPASVPSVAQEPAQAAQHPAPQVPLPPAVDLAAPPQKTTGMTLKQALERCAERRGC